MSKIKSGFTLVELLIVMSIIGVLVTIGIGSFRTAQMRGRDAERKSDLKQISHALELYYSDHGFYPAEVSVDLVNGSSLTDGKTVYFKELPSDPSSGYVYKYRRVPSDTTNKSYQLFAYLENPQDINILPVGEIYSISCGASNCNFAVTSPNAKATDN